MRKTGIGLAVLFCAMILPNGRLLAEEDPSPVVSGEIHLSAVSKYLFRGAKFDDFCLQPGFDISIGDFSLGFWASADGEKNFDEMDFTAAYGRLFGKTTLTGGFTAYTYPSAFGFGTMEFFGTLEWDIPTAPSLGVYYDLVLDTLYAELGLGHTFEFAALPGFGFELGVSAGYVLLPSSLDLSAPSVLGLSLTPSYAVGPATFSLTGFCQVALDKAYDSDWFVSLATSFGF